MCDLPLIGTTGYYRASPVGICKQLLDIQHLACLFMFCRLSVSFESTFVEGKYMYKVHIWCINSTAAFQGQEVTTPYKSQTRKCAITMVNGHRLVVQCSNFVDMLAPLYHMSVNYTVKW